MKNISEGETPSPSRDGGSLVARQRALFRHLKMAAMLSVVVLLAVDSSYAYLVLSLNGTPSHREEQHHYIEARGVVTEVSSYVYYYMCVGQVCFWMTLVLLFLHGFRGVISDRLSKSRRKGKEARGQLRGDSRRGTTETGLDLDSRSKQDESD